MAEIATGQRGRRTGTDEMDPRGAALAGWLDVVGWPGIGERTPDQARVDYQVLVSSTTRWTLGRRGRGALATSPDGAQRVPVRVYHSSGPARDRPILLWIHGGGLVVGDLFTADATCRKLAAKSGAVVVSVDYRRTPEHPLPAAQEDVRLAVGWAFRHARELGADPARLVVAGDSAGGLLAAHVAQWFAGRSDVTIAAQILVYPATDLTLGHVDLAAAKGFFDAAAIDWFGATALAGVDRRDPMVSPMFTTDLAGLPPAHILLAGADPFAPDGAMYAEKLTAAGVPVKLRTFHRQLHGFVDMDLMFPAGAAAIASMARTIRAVVPVRIEPETATPEAIRWAGTAREAATRAEEALLRTPVINTGRIMSTLAAEYWRRPGLPLTATFARLHQLSR